MWPEFIALAHNSVCCFPPGLENFGAGAAPDLQGRVHGKEWAGRAKSCSQWGVTPELGCTGAGFGGPGGHQAEPAACPGHLGRARQGRRDPSLRAVPALGSPSHGRAGQSPRKDPGDDEPQAWSLSPCRLHLGLTIPQVRKSHCLHRLAWNTLGDDQCC